MYKVYYLKSDTEYVKTFVPLTVTTDIKSAYGDDADFDDDGDVNFAEDALINIEKLFKAGLTEIQIEFFDTVTKTAVYRIAIRSTIDPKIMGYVNPTVTLSPEEKKSFDTIMTIWCIRIDDILMRTSLAGTTLSKKIDDMASKLGLASPDLSKSSSLDDLVDKISKNTKAEIVKPKETLKDYVCNPLLMEELVEIKDFFENRETYRKAKIDLPKGILFKGPWGTGKTYAARCIAGTVNCYFMTCTASALQGMYIGSGAENIRNLFKGARMLAEKSKKGVILFIDELDSFGDRQNRGAGSSGEEDRTLNQLLAEMSGFEDTTDVLVLAATNFPERLDSALMRSGRFGRQITIDYPDEAERLSLVKYYFDKISLSKDPSFCYDDIASLTRGLTPADIKEVANESGILTIRQKKTDITLDNVNEAINKVITKNIRHPDKDKDELKIVTAHECGHTVAEVLYNGVYPVKVTNYSYGDAGGFTQMASPLNGLKEKKKFIAKVKVALAGRAAEEAMCGLITNGASADLKEAKNILKHYYLTYHFDKYKYKDIDQIVIDDVDKYYNEVLEDFKKADILKILKNLANELYKKRVLYTADFSLYMAHILGKKA